MPKIEYRVRPVVRYIVTRYSGGPDTGGKSETRGEFDNFEVAHTVAYAMCKHEHEMAGTPAGDMDFIYPSASMPSVLLVPSDGESPSYIKSA